MPEHFYGRIDYFSPEYTATIITLPILLAPDDKLCTKAVQHPVRSHICLEFVCISDIDLEADRLATSSLLTLIDVSRACSQVVNRTRFV
jgi:hypothetical protein